MTLKAKYDELKELDKKRPNKEVVAQFNVPRIHFLVVTNQSRPLSDEQIVSEFSEQPAEVITDGDDENEDKESDEQIAHPARTEVDEAIRTFNKLSLFTEDSGFDALILKPTRIINQ